jgi:1,4-dihydroxy-2-naphthoate octaprenyltransferase
MLAVQSDTAMRRVGLDPELKARVFAAWREGDYHTAAGLIPDELVDAFILCGTPAEIAGRAALYAEAGMTLPVLQPVLQETDQVEAVLQAAVEYGSGRAAAVEAVPAGAAAGAAAGATVAGAGGLVAGPAGGLAARSVDRVPLVRRLRGFAEITRPFSLTASIVPVAAAGALALLDGRMHWGLFALALIAGVLLQVGTNVINEVYDVRKGVDSITSPRASQALVTGRVKEKDALVYAYSALALCGVLGLVMVVERGWPLLLIGAFGLVMGWGYTAPPLQYKYRALGLPLVFVLMGPLMVLGGYYAVTGRWSWDAAVASVPIGLLVTAILHGNEWRDIGEDARAGIRTISISAGRSVAHWIYVVLLVGAYVTLALGVAFNLLPRLSLLAVLSMPLLVQALRASELGATGQQREIAMIDRNTARLHAAFGALFVLGLAVASA